MQSDDEYYDNEKFYKENHVQESFKESFKVKESKVKESFK